MIRFIYGHDLGKHGALAQSMFKDRADQFRARLGWDVSIDDAGEERDEYDALDPLYVVWQRPDGLHGGSMRLLPTTGRCMVNEHFQHILGGGTISSPLIWECTRFCLSRDTAPGTAAALMLAGGEIMERFGVRHYAGVFDARMVRIYRMIGASPEILGSEGDGRDRISVGLWQFTPTSQARVAKSAGIAPALMRHWFDRSFGRRTHGLKTCAA